MTATAVQQRAADLDDFVAALIVLLGSDSVIVPCAPEPEGPGEASLDAYVKDWRGRYHGQPLAIARPRDTAEVAAVVKLCQLHKVAIVPQGGNTSLVGASVPDTSGEQLLLSLTRLNEVLSIDPDNLAMTVQAGCVLADVQQAAQEAGLLFPLSLAAEGSCTIGGNLATNAGGTQVLRYGTARELCLGLEVVTAQGDIWHGLTALRKDNSGYDLRDLFIGSEGTLGIITAASLRLFPRPAGQATALVACPDLQAALALLQRTRQALDAGLVGFELMHAWPLALVRQHLQSLAAPLEPLCQATESRAVPEWVVLIDTGHPESHEAAQAALESVLTQALDLGEALDASLAQSQQQRTAMWGLREAIPSAERSEGLMVKHDIGVPTSAIPTFVLTTEQALQIAFPGCRVACFGHMGDGNLHYNVAGPAGQDSQAFVHTFEAAVNRVVYDAALALNGTLSAEHGIGHLKREVLTERKSPVALQLMRSLKQALDPAGLMNPGRLLAPAEPR